MIKWSVYVADRDHAVQARMVLGTFELISWLTFRRRGQTHFAPDHIITINKMRKEK
jgi:hypothetical protein